MRHLFLATICFMLICSCASNHSQMCPEEQLATPGTALLKRYASTQPAENVKIVIKELDGEKFSGTASTIEVLPGSHTVKLDFVVPWLAKPGHTRSTEIRFNAEEGGEYAFGYPSHRPYKLKIFDTKTGKTVSY